MPGLVFRKIPVTAEIGLGLLESSALKKHKPRNKPLLDIFLLGIDINRKIEEVRGNNGRATRSLKHIETLANQNIRLLDRLLRVCNNIVGQMGIDRSLNLVGTCFDGGQKMYKAAKIVALWKTLALHQPSLLKNGVRIQKAIGCNQLNPGVIRPASQNGLQYAGKRTLAHSNAACYRNDKRRSNDRSPEKRISHKTEILCRLHMQVEEARQRLMYFYHLSQRKAFIPAAKR